MGPPAETDLYRDTWVRYLGYANEIGESFRAIVPISLVWASYGVATTYVTADAIDKGKKAAVGMPGAGSRSRSQRGQLQHLQECGRGCSDPCYCAGDRGQSLLALTHHPVVAREQGAMCRGLGERARGGLAPFEGAGGIPIRHSSDLAASLLCVGCAAQRCQAELCGVFLIGGTTLHTPGQHLPCSGELMHPPRHIQTHPDLHTCACMHGSVQPQPAHARIWMCTPTNPQRPVPPCTHTCTHVRSDTHTETCTPPTCMLSCTHVRSHTYRDLYTPYLHTHLYTCALRHTYRALYTPYLHTHPYACVLTHTHTHTAHNMFSLLAFCCGPLLSAPFPPTHTGPCV
ncbi:mitochondrial fission process protein 1 isoform X4 [Natator depressus]|uniref:mitochondrial fission process protein 1 isoform X4 n=1 Tax=Natator depressus TaxID=27790 RepID=UPI003EB7FBDC